MKKGIEKVKIGVIGTGNMGRNHIRILSSEKNFDLIGIYDKVYEVALQVGDMFGVKVYENLDELINDSDALVVVVPSTLHTEIALRVAKAGKHAFVEKPLATNGKDAKSIVDAFKIANLKLMCGHIERYNSAFIELSKIVKSKDIFYIQANRFSPYNNSGRIKDVSVIEDLMIHDVDLVYFLMNGRKVTSIKGNAEKIVSNNYDFATGILSFGNTAHAIINSSRISQNKERFIDVYTKDACYHADLLDKTLLIYKSTNISVDLIDNLSYKQEGMVQKVFVPIIEPLRAELQAFYNAIVLNDNIPVDGEVALKSIEICEKIMNSIKFE